MLEKSIPGRVRSVAFFGSHGGVISAEPFDMENAIAAGKLPLAILTKADYGIRMKWLFPAEAFRLRLVTRYCAANRVSQADANREIWIAVTASEYLRLEELTHDIDQ